MRKETMIRKVGSKGVILAALFAVPMILTGCVADKFTLSEKPETGKTSIESSVEGRGDTVDSDTEKEERDRRVVLNKFIKKSVHQKRCTDFLWYGSEITSQLLLRCS